MPWLETGLVKLITLAPEIAGGADLTRAALHSGATVSIGHSGADYAGATRYFAAGARQLTHTFNGMPGIHHRQPGLLVAALENEAVIFQIIVDGVHVHPAVVRLLLRLAGRERVAVITDAMLATGLGDGDYALGDVAVRVRDGQARTPEGGLAGSTLTMAQALRNMRRFCDLSLAQAHPHADARAGPLNRHVSAKGLAASGKRTPMSSSGRKRLASERPLSMASWSTRQRGECAAPIADA